LQTHPATERTTGQADGYSTLAHLVERPLEHARQHKQEQAALHNQSSVEHDTGQPDGSALFFILRT
jgi:hypothetical protein